MMTHKFFQKSESDQKKVLLLSGAVLFLCCVTIVLVAYLSGFSLLGALIPIAILIAAPFFDLPSGKKNGTFIYYSPFLITEPEKDGIIVFHGGTLFDYYYTITPDLKGHERTKYVLYGYFWDSFGLSQIMKTRTANIYKSVARHKSSIPGRLPVLDYIRFGKIFCKS